jgi:hypothetical protein
MPWEIRVFFLKVARRCYSTVVVEMDVSGRKRLGVFGIGPLFGSLAIVARLYLICPVLIAPVSIRE